MSRQERIRRERFAPISEEVQDCTHLDLYVTAQQEIAEHSAIAADDRARQNEWNEEMERAAREGGANGEQEMRERWLADRRQAEINPQMKTAEFWDVRRHPNPPKTMIDFFDHDQ